MTHKYQPLLRPAGFATLPNVGWDFVERPDPRIQDVNRPELPRSAHRYGVIATDRPLTTLECELYDLKPIE